MLINPLTPNLGGVLKIGDTPKTPAGEILLHLCWRDHIARAARWPAATASAIPSGFTQSPAV